jgi:hypothetical protein
MPNNSAKGKVIFMNRRYPRANIWCSSFQPSNINCFYAAARCLVMGDNLFYFWYSCNHFVLDLRNNSYYSSYWSAHLLPDHEQAEEP